MKSQFLNEWTGAGILPPLFTKALHEKELTGMMGAYPRRPPNSALSPTPLPITGIRRTALVFWFTIPIAISSAMIPEIVYSDVSPGMAIISNPTEQTQVIASSFSSVRAPAPTASIIPRSSLTGIKAPESPPT